MSSPRLVLAIDQGTTSTRAIVFDDAGAARGSSSKPLEQHFPQPGWVEHDPEEIWASTLAVCREAIAAAKTDAAGIAAIGITNQRETTVVWERATGKPIHRAIVWQDRRTADWCAKHRADGLEPLVQERTGLVLDPYFSASKLAWLLREVPGARAAAERGELAFGTIDCFLLSRLTNGGCHSTDATNASRTMLFDLRRQRWDEELLAKFELPDGCLPDVADSAAHFGASETEHFGRPIPITGIAGDQQAALVGQGCFEPGSMKCTYGTGAFALLNTGETPVFSKNRLLTTVGYRLKGKPTFALEGSIFSAGSAVQWLRDGLKIVKSAADTERLAAEADPAKRVYLVPAFTGLGAPYWDPDARGAIFGLTRDSGPAEIARATLEAVGYQTRDLLEAMVADGAPRPSVLRVDGGMTANGWAMQFLADVLGMPVEVAPVAEATALGAAVLAGMGVGFDATPGKPVVARPARSFRPVVAASERSARYEGWIESVRRARSAASRSS